MRVSIWVLYCSTTHEKGNFFIVKDPFTPIRELEKLFGFYGIFRSKKAAVDKGIEVMRYGIERLNENIEYLKTSEPIIATRSKRNKSND